MTNYRALPDLKIEGQSAPEAITDNILQIVVEESLHRPSMFTLVVRNDYKSGAQADNPWVKDKQLQIGETVSIGFKPSITKTEDETNAQEGVLIQGEITGIEAQFTESTQAPLIFRGYDISHRLHRGRFNRSFQNMTDSDVVKKIVETLNIETDKIDESGEPHDYLFQENQTNMEFLRSRAARIGFELFIRDGKLNFRKPISDETLKLKWLENLRGFRVRVTSTEQVKEVEVRGWDYTTKKPIVANATSESVLTQNEISSEKPGSQASTAFKKMKATPKMIVVDQPVFKSKEADDMAQAICDEFGGQFVTADAKAEGNPQIRPGIVVELEDLGPYSGKYYVTETRHIYSERLYTTEFCVRGLRSGDLLTTLTPPTQLRPGQTLLVGIVTDNEDPDNMGRVKVKFPTLTEDHTSNWARVVSMGAANSRGFDCLPEIDDEVLVAFEHGDIHRPYILGGVWNGEDAPPNDVGDNVQNGKVRLRTFQTRTGHKLQFVEEDKIEKTGIYVETKQGYKIELNESEAFINVTTPLGQLFKISDLESTISTISPIGNIQTQAAGNIGTNAGGKLAATAGSGISMASPKIDLTAPLINLNGIAMVNSPGIVPIKCKGVFSITAGAAVPISAVGAVTITSLGSVAITAPNINLNGVVLINGKPPLIP